MSLGESVRRIGVEPIANDTFLELLRSLLARAVESNFVGYDVEYVALAIELLLTSTADNGEDRAVANAASRFILGEKVPPRFQDVATRVSWALLNGHIDAGRAQRFVREAFAQNPSRDELAALAKILDHEVFDDVIYADVKTELRDVAVAYLHESLNEEIEDSDVFGEAGYAEVSRHRIILKELISDWLTEVGIEATPEDIDALADSYDLSERRERYYGDDSDHAENYRYYRRSDVRVIPFVETLDPIDDLFERTAEPS